MEGWVKLHRCLLNWEWWGNKNMLAAWIYIILMAKHEDGTYRGEVVKRGELITSIRKLSENIGCCNATTLKILDNLEKSGQISVTSERNFTRISVCNYDTYQSFADIERTQNGTQTETENRTKNEQEVDTYNNIKNNKNNNISPPPQGAEGQKIVKVENIVDWLYNESGQGWKEAAAMQLGFHSVEELQNWFPEFANELAAQGVTEKTVDDIRPHFMRMIRIKIDLQKKQANGQRTNKPGTQHTDPRELVKIVDNIIAAEKNLFGR